MTQEGTDLIALAELADRIEKATGPSRHLDTQIFILLDPDAQHIVGKKPGPFPQEAIYGPRSSFWEWACDETKEPPEFAIVPHCTASLDAAMSLVPEGWCMAALCEREPWFCRLATADFDSVTWGKGSDWITNIVAGQETTAKAATPALALCAAALRAIASQEKSR